MAVMNARFKTFCISFPYLKIFIKYASSREKSPYPEILIYTPPPPVLIISMMGKIFQKPFFCLFLSKFRKRFQKMPIITRLKDV